MSSDDDDRVAEGLSAVLRVPAFFILEMVIASATAGLGQEGSSHSPEDEEIQFAAMETLVSVLMSLTLLTVPFEALVDLYMHLMALIAVFTAEMLSDVSEDPEFGLVTAVSLLAVLAVLTLATTFFLDRSYVSVAPMLYSAPILIRLLSDSKLLVSTTHSVSAAGVRMIFLPYALENALHLYEFLKAVFELLSLLVTANGLVAVAISWALVLLNPIVLGAYWIALVGISSWEEYVHLSTTSYHISGVGDVAVLALVVVSDVCRSLFTLVATCIAVSTAAKLAISATDKYLSSCSSHAPASLMTQSGLTEGAIMFVLALQTDLIDLEMPNRVGAMTVILYIVTASLLQTLLDITHPVLMAVAATASVTSASKARSVWNHAKVLAMCAFLFAVPSYMSYLLMSNLEVDIWTLVVLSTSIITSIQVVGHVIHYALFLADALRGRPIEAMDDIVYALKVTSAVLVVAAGVSEAFSGNWNLLNAVVLLAHAYYNVGVRVTKQWKIFLLRKTAAGRIRSMSDASEEQLAARADDVCPICYSEMSSTGAKVTPCGHLYHGGCLKKWLYLRDHCPVCATKIVDDGEGDKTDNDAEHQEAEQIPAAEANATRGQEQQ